MKPDITFETEHLYIRPVKELDKAYYMDLRVATSELAFAYESFPDFREKEWQSELNGENDLYLVVFLKESQAFVASASFQNYSSDVIELGFDVVEEQRAKGIATELLLGMLTELRKRFPGKCGLVRTNATNTACKRVIEKCGGTLSGYEPTVAAKVLASITEMVKKAGERDELLQIKQSNAEYIDKNQSGVCVYIFE